MTRWGRATRSTAPTPDPADAAGGVSQEGRGRSPAGPDRGRRTDAAGGRRRHCRVNNCGGWLTARPRPLPCRSRRLIMNRTLPAEALARVLDAVEASTAAATKKAYRSDWDRFAAWAGRRRFPPLPAPPAVLAHYVTEAAAEQTGVGKWRYAPATLTRWVASINQVHTAAGLDPPGRNEVVRRALSGIRRIRATPQNRRAPLLLDDIRTLLISIGGGGRLAVGGGRPPGHGAAADGVRRRAPPLRTHRAHPRRRHPAPDGRPACPAPQVEDRPGGPRHGEGPAVRAGPGDLPALRLRPVAAGPAGLGHRRPDGRRRAVMTVLRRQAATRQRRGRGTGRISRCSTAAAAPASTNRPTRPGRCSRAVHATGAIGAAAMTGHAIDEMIQRRAAAAGFTPAQVDQLGGHSLRAGFVTEAFRAGADAHAIMRQTGHRSPVMLEVYAREHAPLVGNAVTRLGL